MKTILMAGMAAAAAFVAAPATAAVYDVADFGGAFSYAQFNGGTSFTAFTTPCGFGSACVAGPDGAGNSQVVYDAGDFLVAHPSTSGAPTAVIFTAPTSASYLVNGSAFLADPDAGRGNGVTLTGYLNGLTLPFGSLAGAGDSRSANNFSISLNAGDQLALLIGNNGDNSYDSVGLRGTISTAAVPEPASWAMMIGGIGAAGGMMRRRRSPGVRVTYA